MENPTINYGSEDYEICRLSQAARTWYWQQIDTMAEKILNPWGDLWKKVELLPANLQEMVFVNARKDIFPLTQRERTLLCCSPEAVRILFEIAAEVRMPDIAQLNPLAAIELYIELIVALGDSYTGVEREPQRFEGPAAMAFLAQKLREAKAAKKPEGKPDA